MCLGLSHTPGTVLEGFGEVGNTYFIIASQIGDGPGDFQDAVESPGGEAKLLGGGLEQVFGAGLQLAVFPNFGRPHLRVAQNSCAGKPLPLDVPHLLDPLPNLGRIFHRLFVHQLFVLYRGHLDEYVDAVQQGAR